MFADDAYLYTMSMNFKQVNDNLHNNVKNVHDWYTNNKLAVNVPMSKVMLVKKKGTKILSEIKHNIKWAYSWTGEINALSRSRCLWKPHMGSTC